MHGHSRDQEEEREEDVINPENDQSDILTCFRHYLNAIEDRMMRMESAMHASGITIDDPIEPAIPAVSAQSSIEDKLSIFMINDEGVSGFVGPSSGFSLFSPQGLRWISEKTSSRNFENIIREVAHTCDAVVFPNTFMPGNERDLEPLPPKDLANQYVETYFQTFNCAYPLYDKEMVMARFAKDYYNTTRESDPAWYASLNIIFLIGRGVARKDNGRDFVCERYFNNASSVFSELLFNSPSLLAVQATIGMAFVMQAGEDPHPAYVLVGCASRLAQAIGLHRRLDGYGLSPRDVEQRKNVFWIVLGLEKGISIRSGRPSVFSDDDIGVELPSKDPSANQDLDKPDSVLDSFRSVATLALLESRVYSKLYSARSHTKPELERLKWVGALDTELQQWRDELPPLIRPESPIRCHPKHLMHVIIMHFAYYNCLVAIHRGSVHHGSWINTKKPETVRDAKMAGLHPRVFESGPICLKAARQVIGLLHHYDVRGTTSPPSNEVPYGQAARSEKVTGSGDRERYEKRIPLPGGAKITSDTFHSPADTLRITNLPSMCNYYPLAASLTLFANILQNPLAPTAIPDIALMHCVTSILTSNYSAASSPRSSVHLQIFKEILAVATQFVAKARGEDPEGYGDLSQLRLPENYLGISAPLSLNDWGGNRNTNKPVQQKMRMCGLPQMKVENDSIPPSPSGSTPETHSGDEGLPANSGLGAAPGTCAIASGTCAIASAPCNHFLTCAPVDTPSPGPPPYIPQTPLDTQQMGQSQFDSRSTGHQTPRSRSGANTPLIMPPRRFGQEGSGKARLQMASPYDLNLISSRLSSLQNKPVLPSNAPPFVPPGSVPIPQPSQAQPLGGGQGMEQQQGMQPFDFNTYQWQDQDASQFGGQEGAMYGEMPAQNVGGEEGDFLPMVFQWDLADIWGGQNGLGMGGMGGGMGM